jgi:lactate racemase
METDLAFGRTGIKVKLPGGFRYRLLQARSAKPLPDWQQALEAALDAPIGAPPLSVLASGSNSAAISVCDITRPAPNSKTLPPLLRRLLEAGVPKENVVILIATGLHRPATPDEIREICGAEVAASFRVVNHMARELASHRYLGTAPACTPVYIDDRFVAADLRITLGFIEPHLMLGYSGGRKLIAPGLAAQETIKVLHSPKFMRDPRAAEGSIEDNPLKTTRCIGSWWTSPAWPGTTSCSTWRWRGTGRLPPSSPGIRRRRTGAECGSSRRPCWKHSMNRWTRRSRLPPDTRST